jgi:hypothetical protein
MQRSITKIIGGVDIITVRIEQDFDDIVLAMSGSFVKHKAAIFTSNDIRPPRGYACFERSD